MDAPPSARRRGRVERKVAGNAERGSRATEVRVHEKAIAELTDQGVDLVRVLWSDLHGIARGKDLTIDELPRALEHGVGFCQAVLLTGLDAEPLETKETSGTGWPDAFARPDLDTLAVADHDPAV